MVKAEKRCRDEDPPGIRKSCAGRVTGREAGLFAEHLYKYQQGTRKYEEIVHNYSPLPVILN
jgi:hypothetical protein